jgi:Grx4 family monothiol glutaredoxin
MNIQEISSVPPENTQSVLFFWSSWHEATAPQGSISNLFETLARASPNLSFYRVEAEVQTHLSSLYGVTVVPSFVLLNGNVVFDTIEGADDVARLTQAVSALLQHKVSTASSTDNNDNNNSGSNFETDPQHAPSQPKEEQQQQQQQQQDLLQQRLKRLIQSSPVMLFMKGSPTAPRCGFSRQAVELLNEAKIAYSTFDILTDESVRQGLKTYSDWPTYPQIYVHGELVGGLDILKEMTEEGGDLATQFNVPKMIQDHDDGVRSLEDRLKALVNRSKVMLFMKGLPSQPRCGFSRQICEILKQQNVAFDAFDILSDEEVRQGLKTFSDWPTYPQLYVNGDLVGGLDIVKEMVENDEFQDLMQ